MANYDTQLVTLWLLAYLTMSLMIIILAYVDAVAEPSDMRLVTDLANLIEKHQARKVSFVKSISKKD